MLTAEAKSIQLHIDVDVTASGCELKMESKEYDVNIAGKCKGKIIAGFLL